MIVTKRLRIGLNWLLFTFGFLAPAYAANPNPDPRSWINFDHVENDTLYFTTRSAGQPPKPLKTSLFDLKYLGVLRPKLNGLPYFIFTGKACQKCSDGPSVYLIRPTPDEKPDSFIYPGRISEKKFAPPIFESRAYFGKCLPGKGDVYVVFQTERNGKKKKIEKSVHIAEADQNHLAENLMERHLPHLASVLPLVKRKICQEIPPQERIVPRQALDLRPGPFGDEDDDATDETSKESVESPSKKGQISPQERAPAVFVPAPTQKIRSKKSR